LAEKIITETVKKRPAARLQELAAAVARVILGKDEVVRLTLASLLARGHLLIEDIPGVGKTTLAQALARSIRCSFQRIQFTSDLLPSDILGIKVFEPKSGEFRFLPGPIFNSIVLADEINRTTPRTQSALLEAMNEGRVTIEGETYPLPRPFLVVATQNPLEHHGTYPLPDSQLDRFMMSIAMGYPAAAAERTILSRAAVDPMAPDFPAVMDGQEIIALQELADRVRMEPPLVDYILALVAQTRAHPRLRLGVSPRGALALRQAAKALALVSGRDYCLPDDVKALAGPVFSHRIIAQGSGLIEEKRRAAAEVIEEILARVKVPL
jgi:MoxR-like ATPase